MTTNEAAERLLAAVSTEAEYTSDRRPDYAEGYRQAAFTIRSWLAADLPDALAAERRATVERIRAAVNACEEADDMPRLYPKVLDILDEEAGRE